MNQEVDFSKYNPKPKSDYAKNSRGGVAGIEEISGPSKRKQTLLYIALIILFIAGIYIQLRSYYHVPEDDDAVDITTIKEPPPEAIKLENTR